MPPRFPLMITYENLQQLLWIIVAIMLIVVLYNLLFVVTDLRKILRRIESLTAQVEAFIVKPLAIIDEALLWLIALFEQQSGKKKRGKKGKGSDFSNAPI